MSPLQNHPTNEIDYYDVGGIEWVMFASEGIVVFSERYTKHGTKVSFSVHPAIRSLLTIQLFGSKLTTFDNLPQLHAIAKIILKITDICISCGHHDAETVSGRCLRCQKSWEDLYIRQWTCRHSQVATKINGLTCMECGLVLTKHP